jgi:inner membrane protein YidH
MEPSDDVREPDYRFTLANERTFLAWIRTALALIAGGVAVVQLVPSFGYPGLRNALGFILTAGGGLLAALAVRRWQHVQSAMRRGADLPPSRMPMVLAGAIALVAILVLVVLVVTLQRS